MRFSVGHYSKHMVLGACLLGQLAPVFCDDEFTRSAMVVSVTVLSSCEVRVNDAASAVAGTAEKGLSAAAIVNCPVEYPFRARLAYQTPTGFVESGAEELVFSGVRSIDLSSLSGTADRRAVNGIAMLTVAY